jgi:hypothetical protein
MSSTTSTEIALLATERCRTADELHDWVHAFGGVHVPRRAVCANHDAPFDYVVHSYFEPAKDVIVCAPRGGGKTRLAATLTLADLLHKPGCAVRILGGSLEQSLRMWEHLLPAIESVAPHMIVTRPRSARRITLSNGSSAAVLTQSERAVRGLRVQKLRCDEVELFQPEIWEAAQLVTRSTHDAHGQLISGAIEAISTHHKVHGLMSRLIDRAQQETTNTRVIRWCLLEVLEKCPPQRQCSSCALWDECQGVAKTKCDGFFRIDDAIAMKHRVSVETWEAEMLCKRPVAHESVFPSFDRTIHVRLTPSPGSPGEGRGEGSSSSRDLLSLALDFGFHSPFVCLWIHDDGVTCHVIDEYVQPQRTIGEHVDHIESRPYGRVRRISCDPSGAGRNDQTAESNVQYLRRRGYKVFTKHSQIVEGLELVRAALRPAAGSPTLFIHPNCKRLIAAMEQYRYPSGGGELPLKDGTHDHLIDALRYHYVNRSRGTLVTREY